MENIWGYKGMIRFDGLIFKTTFSETREKAREKAENINKTRFDGAGKIEMIRAQRVPMYKYRFFVTFRETGKTLCLSSTLVEEDEAFDAGAEVRGLAMAYTNRASVGFDCLTEAHPDFDKPVGYFIN